MTCAHVLGIIDAGAFADCSPADLAAARAHAMQCAACGMALAAADAVTSELQQLSVPAPAPDLSKVVLARIARIEDEQGVDAPAVPAASREYRLVWMTTAGAVASLVLMLFLYTVRPMPDLSAGRIGVVAPSAMVSREGSAGALLLLVSLWVFVSGVFAPLGHRSSHE